MAPATPAPVSTPAGPCAQGALASISDRPGIGRAPATNGAACVVLPHSLIFEAGYRNQETVGPQTQTLSVYPNLTLRYGLPAHNEVLLSGLIYSQRSGQETASGLTPATGQQDAGIGVKHLLHDRAWLQDAINLFVTLPTGYPTGVSGFTAGLTTYTFGYSIVVPAGTRVELSSTQNLVLNAAPDATGAPQRSLVYQPALALSYALSPNTTFLLEDQAELSTPGAPAGNRGLIGVQWVLSSNIVVDAEFEANLLPIPGVAQHAIGAGITVMP